MQLNKRENTMPKQKNVAEGEAILGMFSVPILSQNHS